MFDIKPCHLCLLCHSSLCHKDIFFHEQSSLRTCTKFEVGGLLYFQLSYPRTEAVRKGWVLRQLGKLVVFLGLIGFIIEQVKFS
jgi:hypothetical protein